MREGRPFVILKAAISQDGCLAQVAGTANAADLGGGEPARARRPGRG